VKKKIYSFLYLLPLTFYLSQGFSQAVSSPDVKCVSVAANGDVTLTWVTPAGPGGFIDYKIFSSLTPAGPYSLVGTVNTFTQTSYIHVGAGANTQRVYYLVQTEYNPGAIVSAPFDNVSTIHLVVTNIGFGTGNAQLTWNTISSASAGWYKIYMQYPVGSSWALHDSTQNLSYTDKFHVCNDSILYRVEIADISGCTSVSNLAGKTIKDNTPPTPSPIDTVSVNAANKATISWYPSSSTDVDSVIIYKGPPWIPIASVKAPLTSYTYTASTAGTGSEAFRVAFKDSCGKLSIQSVAHQTIFLSASFDPCAGKADLTWNKYINMVAPADQYEVLRSVNAGPFSLIANFTDTNHTTYTDTGLVIGTAYCYIVRVSNGTKTSSSNKTCFTPSIVNPPAFTYNRFATVLSDKSILVTGHVDTASSIAYYHLERTELLTGVSAMVATKPKPAGNAITYTDNNVNTQSSSYSYKWEAMNSCNKVIMSSNSGTTILLEASVAPNVNIDLSWSNYSSWLGNVDHYEIYRAIDGVWNASPIATAPYTATGGTYTDDVSPFFATSKGVFSYYVVSIEGNGNAFGLKDSSRSNVAKVYEYPKIYVPNCFTPNGDGLNDIFIPVIGFINPSEYSFEIFDNTGTPVIIINNPTEGWDGKKKGHNCQEGVYMYIIDCTASNGDNSRISGTISLIR